MPQKELLIVAGPNGAGKSTFVGRFLSERPCPYLSADLIATELTIKEPVALQFAAGQEFLARLQAQLLADRDFIVETTLSGLTWRKYLRQARELGFEITIYFIYLDSADTCVARVTERVRCGGHGVPEQDIRRRFSRSLANFWNTYRKIADHWAIAYNPGGSPVEVAFGYQEDFAVTDETLFRRFLELAEVESDG
ncbi:MAG: AAA family ATPase [Pirellulales bacterium]